MSIARVGIVLFKCNERGEKRPYAKRSVRSRPRTERRMKEILDFRTIIEERYKKNPTGCGNSFGEILCFEIHHGSDGEYVGGLTFLWLAEKWKISVTFLGELISDHCERLETQRSRTSVCIFPR